MVDWRLRLVGGCVHWVLQPGGVWWRAHLVRRLLARGAWRSRGVSRLAAATQCAEVVWDRGRPGQSREDPRVALPLAPC